MKQRNLSGIYFRYKNPETDKWENWTFEDLPEDAQYENMRGRSEEWLKQMCILLAKTVRRLGDQFNIEVDR